MVFKVFAVSFLLICATYFISEVNCTEDAGTFILYFVCEFSQKIDNFYIRPGT